MSDLAATVRNLSATKLIIMAVLAVALIIGFSMIALRVSSPALTPIYSNLTLEDSAKIVTELERLGVPYELRANGAQIMVPSDRMLRLRMNMAEQGLPSGGSLVGYEIFDKSDSFGSSNFVLNVNMIRALEGELSRTISSFSEVEKARVHLVVPKRELFSKDKLQSSASVALKLLGNGEISKSQINSITYLVASSVPGLKSGKVTVVDNHGRLLARGDGEDSVGAVASAAEEYKVAFERRTESTLQALIEKVVGPGNVKVQVAAKINFDRVITDSETFDPEGQVARSVQSVTERENSNDSASNQAVTVGNQLPNAQAGGGAGDGSSEEIERTDETTNFEISKTIQKHIREGGEVEKLSVAVLVDGTYQESEDEDVAPTYIPRTEEELSRIESLAKTAVGYDEERGDSLEIANMQFTQEDIFEEETDFFSNFKSHAQGIIQTLIIAGVAIVAIILVLRPAILHLMKNTVVVQQQVQSVPQAQMPQLAAAGEPSILPSIQPGMPPSMEMPDVSNFAAAANTGGGGAEEEDDNLIDIGNVKGRIKSSVIRKITQIVDENPDETLSVLRTWMSTEQ